MEWSYKNYTPRKNIWKEKKLQIRFYVSVVYVFTRKLGLVENLWECRVYIHEQDLLLATSNLTRPKRFREMRLATKMHQIF